MSIDSLGVENGLSVIQDYECFFGAQERSEGGQVFSVFDTGADNFGEPIEKIGTRSRKLVATDESPIITKPPFDAIVVEDGQGDGCFPDATCPDESDWIEILC